MGTDDNPLHNPLLEIDFDIPFDRIRAEHVEPAADHLLAEARERLRAIGEGTGPRTYDDTLGALEETTEKLERAMGVVGHLESVATTPEWRAAYNAVRPKVSAFYSQIPLDERLWKALRAFAETDEARGLDPVRRRFLDKTVDEMRRHGADLGPEDKKKLEAIDVELTRATTAFSEHVLDATNAFELVVTDEAKLAGLPPSAREAARERARTAGREGFRFTLQEPSLVAVLTYMDDGAIREQVWRAWNTRATSGEEDNRPVLLRILELRAARAKLLGYADFADLVLADRMAKTGARAREFVADLRARTEPFAAREHDALAAFRAEALGGDAGAMAPWDLGYWSEKQRQALYDFDAEELRPYFAVDRVLEGLFALAQRLYGLRIEPWDAPVWDPSVGAWAVRDADGALIAGFYTDVFPRPNKRGGAWMNGLVTGIDGAPHVGLLCANVTPPIGDAPALLTHREVETLFHEFGHLMHHTLSRVPVRSLAGTNVAWDFVELPSQIMENWVWEREALDLFARHVETGATIPAALYDKMVKARSYRAATAMLRQLQLASVDLCLHTAYEPARDGDVIAYARRIMQDFMPVRLPDDYAMVTAFTHLFGSPVAYAAGYYSYKWAEVLDADAFSRFAEQGIFDADVGRAFRDTILARGDSAEPEALFRDFMGREPRLDALLERNGLVAQADPERLRDGGGRAGRARRRTVKRLLDCSVPGGRRATVPDHPHRAPLPSARTRPGCADGTVAPPFERRERLLGGETMPIAAMARRVRSWVILVAAAVAVAMAPTVAHAHFYLRAPACYSAQDGLGLPEKSAPCGQADPGNPPVPTGDVTTVIEGGMLTVTIEERIFHPGHYRVSIATDMSSLPANPPVTAGATPCGSTVIDPSPTLPVLADGLFDHTSAFSGPADRRDPPARRLHLRPLRGAGRGVHVEPRPQCAGRMLLSPLRHGDGHGCGWRRRHVHRRWRGRRQHDVHGRRRQRDRRRPRDRRWQRDRQRRAARRCRRGPRRLRAARQRNVQGLEQRRLRVPRGRAIDLGPARVPRSGVRARPLRTSPAQEAAVAARRAQARIGAVSWKVHSGLSRSARRSSHSSRKSATGRPSTSLTPMGMCRRSRSLTSVTPSTHRA